jgi:hypothetical protein
MTLLFATADVLNRGDLLWETVFRVWPTPFDPRRVEGAALISGDGAQELAFVRNETEGEGFTFQIREEGRLVFLASFLADKTFVAGSLMGVAVDELGAASAVSCRASEISGEWFEHDPDPDPDFSDDEQHA